MVWPSVASVSGLGKPGRDDLKGLGLDTDTAAAQIQGFLFGGVRVPLDLRFRGPLEAKSFVRGPKIDPPGAR